MVSSTTNALIDALACICREHVLDEKWLIAPSRRVAHQWLERVTRAGAPVVNVRVKTTRSLAIGLLAEELAAGRYAVSTPAERRIIVAAAWDRAMDDGGYLGSAKVTPGLLALAEKTLLDLRMAGIASGALDPAHFEDPQKGRELQRLLKAYEAGLVDRKLIDYADAMRLASEQVRKKPDQRAGAIFLLVPQDLRLTALERDLLDAFPEGCRVELAVDRPVVREHTGGDPDLPLFAPPELAAPPSPLAGGSARIVHAVGEVNEVRQALRRCLAGRISLDRVEVLYTAPEPYVPLIYDTALVVFGFDETLDLGVPVTFADGVPARLSRPGRLLAAWLSWIREGFGQSTLLRMLQAGLLRLGVDDEGDPVGAARLARALRSVGIGFGRDRYVRCLDEKVESLTRQLDRGPRPPRPPRHERQNDKADAARVRRRESARALAGIVKSLIETSPTPDVSAACAVASAATLLGTHARIANALDGFARKQLLDEIDTMSRALATAQGAAAPSGFSAWEWLAELPDRLRVGGSGPRPGCVHVASVRAGGHSGRTETIILGLDDSRFPPAGLADPLMLDAERGRLGGAVATSADRLTEQLEDFEKLLRRLRGRVTLSFSSRDLADDRETFASPVVLKAFRGLANQPEGDHRDLLDWMDPPASFAPRVPGECLDPGEWWLCRGAQERAVQNLDALVGATFGHLTRGRQAMAARASSAFTVYDGLVEDPAPNLDPRHQTGPVLSATTHLHVLGRCPLAYFQQQVLGVRTPDDVEVDPQRWLDPLEFGTLMHDVLYTFVGSLIGADEWPPDPKRDLERIASIVDAQVERRRRDVPAPSEEAYRRQRLQIERAAEIFVNEQALFGARSRPLFLEASIGMRPQGKGSAIDTPEPVELRLPGGGTVRARARIDRIDRIVEQNPDDRPVFCIYDYKSGGYVKPYDPPDLFAQGRLLQHVLYMAVVESVLKQHFGPDAVVDEFSFLFPGYRTHGRIVRFPRAIVEKGTAIVETLCRLIGAGAFPATTDTDDCTFCDYRRACRAVDRDLETLCARSARKMSDSSNAVLAPFRELRRD